MRNNIFFMVIADGAGSAVLGGQGASLTCRVILQKALIHFSNSFNIPNLDDFEKWVEEVRGTLYIAAKKRDCDIKDLASTLLVSISDGYLTTGIHIGDGSLVIKEKTSDEWICISKPETGEYASTTRFITDNTVSIRPFKHFTEISTLVAFTDGMERLALDMNNYQPFKPFFDGITRPLDINQNPGKNTKLTSELRAFLDSAKVNSRTDDDKTLVIAKCF